MLVHAPPLSWFSRCHSKPRGFNTSWTHLDAAWCCWYTRVVRSQRSHGRDLERETREKKKKRGREGEREKLGDGEWVSREEVSCWALFAGAPLPEKMMDTGLGFVAREGDEKERSFLSLLLWLGQCVYFFFSWKGGRKTILSLINWGKKSFLPL